jgi:hypothetical protein
MKPPELQSIFSGDQFSIGDIVGEIVFSSISDSYAVDFPKSQWPQSDYKGIVMCMPNGTLVLRY